MREALQQQLRYSKELSEKMKGDSSESEDEAVADEDPESLIASAAMAAENLIDEIQTAENPWMRSTLKKVRENQKESGSSGTTESPILATSEGLKSSTDSKKQDAKKTVPNEIMTRSKKKLQKNVEEKETKLLQRKSPSNNDKSMNIASMDIDEIFDKVENRESVEKTKIIRPEIQEIAVKTSEKKRKNSPKKSQESEEKTEKMRPEPMLDPEKYLKAPAKQLFSAPSDLVETMEESIEEENGAGELENSQANLIAEAFADDDVLAEFAAEKSAIEERNRPKPVDLTLPGWGDWVGPGVRERKRKKKRFLTPAKKRKDQLLPGVILSEAENPAIRKLQVKEVPYPFTSVEEFEASMRHPIGREWNPPSAHSALCQPTIVTKMGAIIKPIDKKLVFRKGKTKEDAFGSGNETDSD